MKSNKAKLFLTAYLQVGLVVLNTRLIAEGNVPAAVAATFALNYLWTGNVKKVALGSVSDRLVYCAGASIGAFCVMIITEMI